MDKATIDKNGRAARPASPASVHDRALALVAHELRTPLTVINGMSMALQRQERWAPNGSENGRAQALADIVDAGRRLERMVDNVLLLATSAGEPFDPEPLNVRAALDHAILRHQRDFPASVVALDRSPPSLVACGIPDWVDLILTNVLRNAAQYGVPSQTIRIVTRRHDHHVLIRIEDGGPALSSSEYQAIFEPFYRGPRSELQVAGAGLGLTVARRLARTQGGSLLAGPIAGGLGTVVTLALPAARES